MRKTLTILGAFVAIATQSAEFRAVDGVTNNISKAEGWLDFHGKVSQVIEEGLLVAGKVSVDNGPDSEEATYLVKNYPKKVIDDDPIGESWYRPVRLKFNGKTFSYKTVLGATRTIRVLDYGTPCTAPPPPSPSIEQITAMAVSKVAKENQKKEVAAKLLKTHQERAAAGYPSAQYDLGMRYLKGDGVAKDENLAREWLQKAAAQDHAEAKAALAKLRTHSNP